MGSRSFLIIALVVVFAFLHSGEALKCYQCDSQTDDSCKNKLETKHEETCSAGVDLCFSCAVQLSDGKEIKQRSCFPSLSPSLGAQEDLKVKSMQCAACNTDLCNAASTNVLTLGWLALLWAIRSIFAGAY
ncbi:hypothetical protein X777_02553 [Ooceraea biroi]|uniref:UPAR/Ly6 domain-containing protein n=1 Tax=Ooceraea biroi TaxID=2015173 RepID=A0A026WMK1_OOCBI|nr:hypothetical protein X777_02553 [Ooceraea biroi]